MYGIRHLTLGNPSPWNPFEEFERLQARLERGGVSLASPVATPAIQLWREGDDLRLRALVPGVKAEDLTLTVEGDVLSISGSHAPSSSTEGPRWLRRERESGTFEHTLQLPFGVDAQGVKARLSNGVLEMELPRAATEKPRRIPVQGT